tara:strand:+ start:612 stop:1028 length:417 start_codon:yes stop_codon:yes gene_type:complete
MNKLYKVKNGIGFSKEHEERIIIPDVNYNAVYVSVDHDKDEIRIRNNTGYYSNLNYLFIDIFVNFVKFNSSSSTYRTGVDIYINTKFINKIQLHYTEDMEYYISSNDIASDGSMTEIDRECYFKIFDFIEIQSKIEDF